MNKLVILLALPMWALAQNQYLMTVGGYDATAEDQHNPPWDNQVSLISLDSMTEVPECLQDLSNFKYLEGSCMANLLGDQPHICGGWDAWVGYNNKCYRYHPNEDSWTETGEFLETRYGGFGLYGCGFTYAHGIVAAGGKGCINGCGPGGPGPKGSVDYTMDGQSFGQLAELPDGIENNCLVGLWGGDLFSAGGSIYGTVMEKAYIYSNSKNEWSQVADMTTPRQRLMCGAVLTGDDSQQEVIVAGGNTDIYDLSPTDVVEIFSIHYGDWRKAKPLPSPIMGATTVPLENTFLILGGQSNRVSDLIYKYHAWDDTWELLDAKLAKPARGVVATMVNSYIFPSCKAE